MKRRTALALTAAGLAAVVAANRRRPRAEHPPLATTLDHGDHVKVETSDGAVLAAHVAGPAGGPTVVLAHCWTGTMDTWAPVAAGLAAAGHRVIRFDHRGHGASTLPGGAAPSVHRLGCDIREVLEHFDVRDAVLAGHSMGGMAAQAFVLDHPETAAERLRHLVLVATAAGGLRRHLLARPGPRTVGSRHVERILRTRHGHVFVRGVFGRTVHPEALRATHASFVETAAASRAQHLVAMFDMELRDRCGTIAVPTTLVHGTRDSLIPHRYARDLATAIPSARLVPVPGAGHMLPYEATDLVARLITEATA